MNNTVQSNPETKKEANRLRFKEVVASLKEEKHGFSPQLFWFALFTIISLIIAYLFPFSLIITIPLVIIPSWFAFNSVTSIKGIKNSENISFFMMFKAYFSVLFFGGYRLFLGFLKAFGIYVGVSSIAFTVYSETVLRSKAEFKAILEKMNSTAELEGVMNELNEFLLSPAMAKPVFLIISIGILLAIFVFLQHILKHSMKMRRNLFTRQPIPMRQFHMVDARVRKNNRKLLWSSYLSTTWFIQLLVILGGAGGLVFSYFFLAELDPFKAVIISVFLIFVLTLPLLNYVSVTQNMLYLALRRKYEETFVNMTLEFLTKFKDKLGLEEEEAKKIEALLNETKKASEDDKPNIQIKVVEDEDDEEDPKE